MFEWFRKQTALVKAAIIAVILVILLSVPLCITGGALAYHYLVKKAPAKVEKTKETAPGGEDEKDTFPPVVSIYEPKRNSTTDQKQITVKGKTESGCKLTVNGVAKDLKAGGLFDCVVDLVSGANTIIVTATDKAGNTTRRQVLVTYNPPPPPPAPATSGGGGGGGSTPPPSGPSICGTCGGVGMVICPNCGGAGGTLCPNGPCPDCNWMGFFPCDTCGGSLYVTCPTCGGSGQI